ncbi:MAG: hypothetical protein QW503_02240 [Sulfolobales archaeon]
MNEIEEKGKDVVVFHEYDCGEAIEIDLEDLFPLVLKTPVCNLLKTLSDYYEDLEEVKDSLLVYHAPYRDEVESDQLDEGTARSLIKAIERLLRTESVDEALRTVPRNREKVEELLRKARKIIVLREGSENCYALYIPRGSK